MSYSMFLSFLLLGCGAKGERDSSSQALPDLSAGGAALQIGEGEWIHFDQTDGCDFERNPHPNNPPNLFFMQFVRTETPADRFYGAVFGLDPQAASGQSARASLTLSLSGESIELGCDVTADITATGTALNAACTGRRSLQAAEEEVSAVKLRIVCPKGE